MRCARAEETGQPMEPSALQQLCDLLSTYEEFKDTKIIHIEIVKEDVRHLEFGQAKDELRHLLQLNVEKSGDADVTYFISDIDLFHGDLERLFSEERVTQRDYVRILVTLAEVFLMFDPPCNDKARDLCMTVKRLDRSHALMYNVRT